MKVNVTYACGKVAQCTKRIKLYYKNSRAVSLEVDGIELKFKYGYLSGCHLEGCKLDCFLSGAVSIKDIEHIIKKKFTAVVAGIDCEYKYPDEVFFTYPFSDDVVKVKTCAVCKKDFKPGEKICYCFARDGDLVTPVEVQHASCTDKGIVK